jgi:hypothetical protein
MCIFDALAHQNFCSPASFTRAFTACQIRTKAGGNRRSSHCGGRMQTTLDGTMGFMPLVRILLEYIKETLIYFLEGRCPSNSPGRVPCHYAKGRQG